MTNDKNNDKNKGAKQTKGVHNQHNNYVLQCLDDCEMGVDFYKWFIADYAKDSFVAFVPARWYDLYVRLRPPWPLR